MTAPALPAQRMTVEQMRVIDIHVMYRAGYLKPGEYTWHWGADTRMSDQAKLTTTESQITLQYRYLSATGWSEISEVIPLDWVPCPFGGKRPVLRCLGKDGKPCGRASWRLHARDGLFRCRICYDLMHTCQREDRWERALRRAQKVREKYGMERNILYEKTQKPKGMHWTTYGKIMAKIQRDEIIADAGDIMKAERMLSSRIRL